MPEPETIWVAVGDTSSGPQRVHTREDCYKLEYADKTTEKDPEVYPPAFRTWCQWCAPDDDTPVGKPKRGGTA